MTETKPWWLSRTIWVGIATALFAILSGLGVLPAELSSGVIEEATIAILAVFSIIFRAKATAEIKPVLPTMISGE